jgi:RNA polymerase sigma factor (sigma-70 family)
MGESPPLVALSEDALWALVEPFQLRLVRFVRGMLGDLEEARDIVQDVLVSAWRTAQRPTAPFVVGADERAVQRWLFRIASNKAIDVLRHRRVIAWETLDGVLSVEPLDAQHPAPFDERLAESEAMRAALDRLDSSDVVCLRLSIVEDFTAVEIAQMLAITPEAARQRLSRATYRLRAAYFTQTDPSPPSPPAPPVTPVTRVTLHGDISPTRRERST